MESYQLRIIELKQKIERLEQENLCLKQLLNEAGISYKDNIIKCGPESHEKEEFYSDQGSRIEPIEISDKNANNFFMLFCRGRQDVYDLRYCNSKTGKIGYYTQCFNRWDRECHINKHDGVRCKDCEIKAYKPITLEMIKAHLRGADSNGNDVVAIYPMLENNMCQLLVFDFDNHAQGMEKDDFANNTQEWMEEVNALVDICKELTIPAMVERSRSGNGAHVWIFFKEQIPAKLARRFGYALLEQGAKSVDLKSFRYYDRMIPTQDTLSAGGLGNVIALPLQGGALKEGNSAFVDENYIPWKDSDTICFSDVDGFVHITLSDKLYIKKSNLSNGLKRKLRQLAAFSNRDYFRNQAMGMPNYDTPRFIYLGEDVGNYIALPRGLRDKVEEILSNASIKYEINDERENGRPINVTFTGVLKESQQEAINVITDYDNGILHAATAFGKTVVCCDLIAKHKVNTLILVDKAELMNQWIERLKKFLIIDEELPEYKTKTGRIKHRDELIGKLQGAHDSMTGIVDVAMIRSLKKKDGIHPFLKQYGQVILDECHHGASDSAIEILKEIQAKYLYGVTATPKRGDGKEKINEFLLGPIRYRFTAKDRAKEQGIPHLVYPRFTRTVVSHRLNNTPYGNAAFELIRNNEIRDMQIANDVGICIEAGRTPVILTKFVDHAEKLFALVQNRADRVILLTGKNGTKMRKAQVEKLNCVKKEESLILVGTGSLLGEGFDYPRLDTLFMATPIKGENVVEQYVGRLNRDYSGKDNVIVYDICSGIVGEKQVANTIYDIDTYGDVYNRDLHESKESVVISSPRINTKKVKQLIEVLTPKYELGLNVTIVTWHPDCYKYGNDSARFELIENLRRAGFEIRLKTENCERFAVIDKSIVWYGSINLLSKEDEEDNIMRIDDASIAAEVLELM
jgi:superfamily II DNA or RNA helicase